jgi:hypothetical protein
MQDHTRGVKGSEVGKLVGQYRRSCEIRDATPVALRDLGVRFRAPIAGWVCPEPVRMCAASRQPASA